MTITVPCITESSVESDTAGLCHVVCYCRTDNLALCGVIAAGPWRPCGDYPDDCIVCADLEQYPCPRCGA